MEQQAFLSTIDWSAADMSISEEVETEVLLVVTSFANWKAFGRTTLVRLGMSVHHCIVDRDYSPELYDEDT